MASSSYADLQRYASRMSGHNRCKGIQPEEQQAYSRRGTTYVRALCRSSSFLLLGSSHSLCAIALQDRVLRHMNRPPSEPKTFFTGAFFLPPSTAPCRSVQSFSGAELQYNGPLLQSHGFYCRRGARAWPRSSDALSDRRHGQME